MANTKAKNNENTPIQIIYRVLMGILFGLANVIPGVSGGTAMVVCGVYERIIGIITDVKNRIKKEWRFFLPIVIGMGIAIILFGMVMDKMLKDHSDVTQMFFIGVIIFSIPALLKKAIFTKKKKLKIDAFGIIAFALMCGLMVFMFIKNNSIDKDAIKAASKAAEYAPDHSIGRLLLLIVFGAIACSTMIIPGISGSLVMVMMGVYGDVMAAISHMDILFLAPFGIGCLLGLVFCAKLIRWLLENHERITYCAILGFVFGSILPVFPGFSAAFSIGGIIAFILGGACIVGCEMLSKKN